MKKNGILDLVKCDDVVMLFKAYKNMILYSNEEFWKRITRKDISEFLNWRKKIIIEEFVLEEIKNNKDELEFNFVNYILGQAGEPVNDFFKNQIEEMKNILQEQKGGINKLKN